MGHSRATIRLTIAVTIVAFTLSPVRAVGPPADHPYFPQGAFDEDKEINDLCEEMYTKALRAAGEPSLWKLAKGDRAVSVYRLLWVPSFHHRVVVRIVKSGDSIMLHAVELDGKAGLNPGKIAIKKSMKLTEDQWTWLLVHLARARYWKMQRVKTEPFGAGVHILDGDSLVCEGVEEGKYHVVDRDNADLSYETICWYMLSLSGLDVKEAWLYYHEDEVFKKVGK